MSQTNAAKIAMIRNRHKSGLRMGSFGFVVGGDVADGSNEGWNKP